MAAVEIDLKTRPFPGERCLRPSSLGLVALGATVATTVAALRIIDEHLVLGLGVIALVFVTFFGLMIRALRTAARATSELNAGRVDTARELFVTAAKRSWAFPRIHVSQLLNLAILELQRGRNDAALSLLSSSWRAWGHDAYSRTLVANAFGRAWDAIGEDAAAKAWRAEAQRRDRQASKESPPSATVARAQTRLFRWSVLAFLVGCVALFAGTQHYPPTLVDPALLFGLPISALAVAGWLLVVWRKARNWHTARSQLWLALFVPLTIGGGGVGMAATGITLGLNCLLDRSPTVRTDRLVLGSTREGPNVRVTYEVPGIPGTSQELLDENDERAARIEAGARHLTFSTHKGLFGVAWAEEETAAP